MNKLIAIVNVKEVTIKGDKEMTKLERIKDMLGYIKNHIENCELGYDMDDDSYIIKYKDGSIKYINGYDMDEGISLNARKIDYIVGNCASDGWDSEGKSWLRNFTDGKNFTEESVDAWNEYVNTMLY